jgi:hypothetical protein
MSEMRFGSKVLYRLDEAMAPIGRTTEKEASILGRTVGIGLPENEDV